MTASGGPEKYVAIALADYGVKIHPSLAHLCAKTGLHRNTLSRAICSMRAKGIIRTYGTGKALTYTLDMHFKGDGTVPFKVTHRTFKGDAPSPLRVRDPNYQRTTKEPQAADAAYCLITQLLHFLFKQMELRGHVIHTML